MARTLTKAKKPPREALAVDETAPTAERHGHGLIERGSHAIADEAGRPSRPFRSVDTLLLMLRRHSISPAMHQAGEDFRALFHLASLEPLRAPDLSRIPGGPRDVPLSMRQAEARRKIWDVLKALGGIASPAGSCIWHVVGCEWSVKDWALREGWNGRPLSQEAASGILIGGLGVLQGYFGLA